jgi:hypothetical protein
VYAQVSCKEQDQDNQYDHAYAADGIITPILTVRPSGKTSDKRHDDEYRENEHEHHRLAARLTAVGRCLSAPAWADSATRGSSISFFALARSALYDFFLPLLILRIYG